MLIQFFSHLISVSTSKFHHPKIWSGGLSESISIINSILIHWLFSVVPKPHGGDIVQAKLFTSQTNGGHHGELPHGKTVTKYEKITKKKIKDAI